MSDSEPIRLLFVCMGNICRSPTAQGVAEAEVARRGWQRQVLVDSAGTHAYHVGEPPDRRAREAAARRGIDLEPQRARRVADGDFTEFDYILAMDEQNLQALLQSAPARPSARIEKMLRFGKLKIAEDVPDPYYGGRHGFEQVLDLLEDAVAGLMDELAREHGHLGQP